MNVKKYSLVMETERTYAFSDTLDNRQAAYEFLTDKLNLDKRPEEHFVVLSLDAKLNVIGVYDTSTGGISATAIEPYEVFKAAIISNAAFIIIAHNHPSGSAAPSEEDNTLTARLRDCGDLLHLPIVDHLIVGNGHYYDYRASSSIFNSKGVNA